MVFPKIQRIAPVLFLGLGFFINASALQAKQQRRSDDISVLETQLVGTQQDVDYLMQTLKQLRLEVEVLRGEVSEARRSEQAALLRQNQLIENYNTFVNNTRTEFQRLKEEAAAMDERQKREIVDAVTRQIEKMGAQMQRTMAQSGSSHNAESFSSDYPKEGVAYTVRSGDTLSKIAHAHGSSVRDIQNANQIADPRDLRSGQTIFIPQRKN
jgi:nucleoid-associated protein YgaU